MTRPGRDNLKYDDRSRNGHLLRPCLITPPAGRMPQVVFFP
jgi:hypothetical protein